MSDSNQSSQDEDGSNPKKTTPTNEDKLSDKKFKNDRQKDPNEADHDSKGRPNNPFS